MNAMFQRKTSNLQVSYFTFIDQVSGITIYSTLLIYSLVLTPFDCYLYVYILTKQ